ncbi:MAG: methyltransferase domain-containing protein [Acidobacteria bacterium]|nr:methyltransferase domain-containing protein [Acidobacteriota bacterium]
MSQSKQTLESIQADFDRIALLTSGAWDHNAHYHKYLLKQIPSQRETALEVGCGTGEFTRNLAQRFGKVVAVDLSPQMIHQAGERSRSYGNIDFVVADVLNYEFDDNQFDFIATIATAHHLPMKELLEVVKRSLRPDGVFVCLDLYERSTLVDIFYDIASIPLNLAFRLVKTGRILESEGIRQAYVDHGRTDKYSTISEVEYLCSSVLRGAVIKRHLFWRYSIIWKKAVIE